MRNIFPYLLVPFLLLSIFLIAVLVKVVPRSWKIGLLGLSAMLISAIPAEGQIPEGVRCYRQPANPEVKSTIINETSEWQEYHKAYLDMLDYMAVSKYDVNTYEKKLATLNNAENALNHLVEDNQLDPDVYSALKDGMKDATIGYHREQEGITCYKMAISDELERRFAFGSVVARQLQLRTILYSNQVTDPETIKNIQGSMFAEAVQYLDGRDFELYRKLILDLTDYN